MPGRVRVLVLVVAAVTGVCEAQMQRAFVASTGDDANPCTRALPCRSFATAVATVLPGGEVVVLDSAGYGPVTLSGSVSILAPDGVYAGVTAFAGDGITVDAPPDATIAVRGLTIGNGQSAENGIHVVGAGTVYVAKCTIGGFGNAGVYFANAGVLVAEDVVARENNADVWIQPNAGNAIALINRCRLERGSQGLFVAGLTGQGTHVALRDSVVSGVQPSTAFGIFSFDSVVDVKGCEITGNGYGIVAEGSATGGVVTVGESIISGNSTGLGQGAGGTVISFGTNELCANTRDSVGLITPGTLQ